jgi:hypothetical protein
MEILSAAVGNQQDGDHGEVEVSCYGNRSSHWSATATGAVAGGPLSIVDFLVVVVFVVWSYVYLNRCKYQNVIE